MNNPNALKLELIKGLEEIGLTKNDNCYVTGNISALARTKIKKNVLLPLVQSTFQEVMGPMGTIFSPSASMNLCNTNIPYDNIRTPSYEMGALAEHFRLNPRSIRSLHPFWSISGLGQNADVLKNVSRHSYGAGSPWSSFLDLNVLQVNVGLHPSKAVTLIHHVEVASGVPYRYTKEFLHPIINEKGLINIEPFYMSVMYNSSDVRKRIALNEHYFSEMKNRNLIKSHLHSSGLKIWAFRMKDFYDVALKFFIDDIYNYLEHPPKKRPYGV